MFDASDLHRPKRGSVARVTLLAVVRQWRDKPYKPGVTEALEIARCIQHLENEKER
jgi:hypothetical protein